MDIFCSGVRPLFPLREHELEALRLMGRTSILSLSHFETLEKVIWGGPLFENHDVGGIRMWALHLAHDIEHRPTLLNALVLHKSDLSSSTTSL